MKTREKLTIAFKKLENLNSEFDNDSDCIKALSEALNAANDIIDLQKLRIAELEEDNSTLVDKVERLEENIQVLLNAR